MGFGAQEAGRGGSERGVRRRGQGHAAKRVVVLVRDEGVPPGVVDVEAVRLVEPRHRTGPVQEAARRKCDSGNFPKVV